MPELIEVETYRTQAEVVIGRTIGAAPVLDELGLRRDDPRAVRALLVGCRVLAVDRIGKLLLLRTDGPVVGLRFGMTGRLLVDGHASIEQLQYGSAAANPSWDRFVLEFTGGGELRIRDPRRLGGLELDPDLSALGPDATRLDVDALAGAVARSRTSVKARLLDQRRIAGLGNLLVDEILWRAGIDPERPCDQLGDDEVADLARTIRATVADLSARGGSHTGDLQSSRVPGGHCPRDGTPLDRVPVGGRTTYRCPWHQR